MTCPRCDGRGTKDYASFAMEPCDNPDCGLTDLITGRPVEQWALDFMHMRKTVRERVARALSYPEHHTTWDMLDEVEKSLFYQQADYAIDAMLGASGTEARQRPDPEEGLDPKGDGPTLEERDAHTPVPSSRERK